MLRSGIEPWKSQRNGVLMDKNRHRYTQCAQNVFQIALEEARDRKSKFVLTEHLLLGIIKNWTDDIVAVRVLKHFGLTALQIQTLVDALPDGAILEIGEDPIYHKNVFFAGGTAEAEARTQGKEYVGTEHLLLALINGGVVGHTSTILRELNVDIELAREYIRSISDEPTTPTGPQVQRVQISEKELFGYLAWCVSSGWASGRTSIFDVHDTETVITLSAGEKFRSVERWGKNFFNRQIMVFYDDQPVAELIHEGDFTEHARKRSGYVTETLQESLRCCSDKFPYCGTEVTKSFVSRGRVRYVPSPVDGDGDNDDYSGTEEVQLLLNLAPFNSVLYTGTFSLKIYCEVVKP